MNKPRLARSTFDKGSKWTTTFCGCARCGDCALDTNRSIGRRSVEDRAGHVVVGTIRERSEIRFRRTEGTQYMCNLTPAVPTDQGLNNVSNPPTEEAPNVLGAFSAPGLNRNRRYEAWILLRHVHQHEVRPVPSAQYLTYQGCCTLLPIHASFSGSIEAALSPASIHAEGEIE